MRIGIVSETYPPEINGVALTVHALASGLAARGHSVEMIRPRRARAAPDEPGIVALDTASLPLPRYPGLRIGLPAGRTLSHRWERLRPDAIYIATEGPLGRSALGVAERLAIPVATGFHTRFDHYASHYGLPRLAPMIGRYLMRFHGRGDATLVPTRALAEELRERGLDNVRLLRRGVETGLFDPARRDVELRRRWGVDGHTPVVLYVGRIAAEKNLSLAADAFRAIQQQVPNARYVWVGDGPARAALETAHPDFVFMGTQRGDALAACYASADLFPFPSVSETFGNVILEALAAGLPVVAFDQGAVPEHIRHAHNGFRIPVGNASAFIEAAVMLAGNPGLIRHMGRAARASVERLSPEAVVLEFEHLLYGLAQGNHPHAHRAIVAHA